MMSEKLINVKIDEKDYQFPMGMTILDACKSAGYDIPTLCYLEGIAEEGACGMCVVEVKKARTLQRACIVRITDGMEITTDSSAIHDARKTNLELALAHHPLDCMTCLLYTSDAADDLLCVDLGGRRIIKKKKKQ